MRLLVSYDHRIDADIYCSCAGEAKQALNEKVISVLIIANKIAGRMLGLELLKWAIASNKAPPQVTIVETDRVLWREFHQTLIMSGYRASDVRNYIKHI